MKNIQALEEALKAVNAIETQNLAATTVDGAGFDTKDFDEVLFVVNAGVTDGTVDIKIQESTDDAATDAYTDIAGAAFVQITSSNDQDVFVGRVRCKNFEQFLRATVTTTGTTSDVGVAGLLGKFDGLAPVTQGNAVAFAVDYVSDGGTEGSQAT